MRHWECVNATKGLEAHSGMHDTTLFSDLRSRHGLVSVYTDLGASGHEKRKTTELLCDVVTAPAVRELLGTRVVPVGWVSSTPPIRGKDERGSYRTGPAEVYPPQFCEYLARAILRAWSSPDAAG